VDVNVVVVCIIGRNAICKWWMAGLQFWCNGLQKK